LITAVAFMPGFYPNSSTASLVMEAVTVKRAISRWSRVSWVARSPGN
jgi:hypothetical protein